MTMNLLKGTLLVGVGGAGGAVLRYFVTVVVGNPENFPAATLTVNISGAFALAMLTAVLVGSGSPRTEQIRLLVGTGLLGGFTTYSGLALDGVQLVTAGKPLLALSYLSITLLGGLAATVGGWQLGNKLSLDQTTGQGTWR